MDLGDLFNFLPIAPGGAVRRERSPAEQLCAGLAMFGLPLVGGCLVFFARLGLHHSAIALFVLPLALAGVACLVCIRLRTPGGSTVLNTAGCALMSFVWCGGALLLDVFVGFFRAF
jgi:hypothetical protein